MVCQFHKNTLLILFSTILIPGVLCFTELQSIHLEVYGLQNANYLIIKYATIQNTNPKSNNDNTTKLATAANVRNNGNVIEKVSDRGTYRVQLRSNESFSSLSKKEFDMQILFLKAGNTSPQSNNRSVIAGPQQQQNTNQLLAPVNGFDITIYSNNGKKQTRQ